MKMDLVWYIVLFVTASVISVAEAQEEITCYGPGSMAASVILTFVCTVLLILALNYWWKRYRKQKDNHLILETDPEKGKGEYAFDNPGFKDTSVLSTNENPTKSKWAHWSPFNGLSAKSEKRKTLDDSALENHQVKVVALQSHDFTGLGFNICGNMKQGIYIKDILHRGPAFESGKLTSGDRINSVTISFEHMVYEDALTILSYASPYEVIVEAKSGKLVANGQGQGAQLSHPVYRSSSCADLQYVDKSSKKRLFDDHSGSVSGSNSSSLQKNSKTHQKIPQKHMTPEQLRTQLEKRISSDHENNLKVKEKHQKSGTTEIAKRENENGINKHQKFGVRVLPAMENPQQLSPKITEQNENNVNIEKHTSSELIRSIDEVDEMKKPQAKKREKKTEPVEKDDTQPFQRSDEKQGSLIKRDENGIPQEIPNFMFNAALAAKNNRKTTTEDDDDAKTPKKPKGKAPSPPDETLLAATPEPHRSNHSYDSDTDVANDSNTTIELAANDITIHQTEVDEEKRQSDRKTASTGDLSKMHRPPRSVNAGTLERAQSLDINAELDSGVSGLSKKEEMASDEDLFGTAVLSKEPRLSLILDGLNTFQWAKLKKSREWGNLEDAILKLNQEERHASSPAANKAEFDALVDKIDEIKREEVSSIPREVIDRYDATAKISGEKEEKKIQNQIWPTTEDDVNELNVIFPKCKDRKPKSKATIGLDSKTAKKQIPVPVAAKENPPQTEKIYHELISNDNKIGRQRDPESHSTTLLPPENLDNNVETFQTISPEPETKPSKQRVAPEKKHNFYNFEPISPNRTPEEPSPDDWEMVTTDLISTSPPLSLTLADETEIAAPPPNTSEYLLSKIPALSLLNTTDESKTFPRQKHTQSSTQNFLLAEQISCGQDKTYDTNVSDDIKVSRHQESPRHSDTSRMPESSKSTEIFTNLDGSRSLEGTGNLECSRSIESSKNLEGSRSLEGSRNFEGSRSLEGSRNLEGSKNLVGSRSLEGSRSSEGSRSLESAKSLEGSRSLEGFRSVEGSGNVESSTINLGSFEVLDVPKCDDAKYLDINNVSNVTVTENPHHSLEWSVNDETSERYSMPMVEVPSKVTVSTPDLIKNVTLTEAITAVNDDNSSATYVTEIQVTPKSNNVSEIAIVPPNGGGARNLETDFENYVKNFEEKLQRFENNIETFETDLSQFINEEPTSIVINDDRVEKEVHKIQEIAEEQLKKLPEMRFTTASYESETRAPEKRHSFEMLRSNFERAAPKKDTPKSRIPIATSSAIATKTPPTSPERRDSRNLDNEHDTAAILELMTSENNNSKIRPPPPAIGRNVTVTSIRSNSKIPSGLPTFVSGGRPPVPPRRGGENEERQHVLHVSTNGNAHESSFKQWVFNPANVTNVTVENSIKEK